MSKLQKYQRRIILNKFPFHILISFLGFASLHSFAQTNNDDLMVNMGSCIKLESAVNRFACYEKQVEAALTGDETYQITNSGAETSGQTTMSSAQTTASIPALVPAAATSASENDFGLVDEKAAKNEEELFGVIAEVKKLRLGQHDITLENGQVWRQLEVNSSYRMKEGQEVRIYSTRWGSSYRLSVTETRGFIQVKRLR